MVKDNKSSENNREDRSVRSETERKKRRHQIKC